MRAHGLVEAHEALDLLAGEASVHERPRLLGRRRKGNDSDEGRFRLVRDFGWSRLLLVLLELLVDGYGAPALNSYRLEQRSHHRSSLHWWGSPATAQLRKRSHQRRQLVAARMS